MLSTVLNIIFNFLKVFVCHIYQEVIIIQRQDEFAVAQPPDLGWGHQRVFAQDIEEAYQNCLFFFGLHFFHLFTFLRWLYSKVKRLTSQILHVLVCYYLYLDIVLPLADQRYHQPIGILAASSGCSHCYLLVVLDIILFAIFFNFLDVVLLFFGLLCWLFLIRVFSAVVYINIFTKVPILFMTFCSTKSHCRSFEFFIMGVHSFEDSTFQMRINSFL